MKRLVFLIVLILFVEGVTIAQLKLYPELGLSFGQSTMLGTSQYLKAGKNMKSTFYGFGIYKPLEKNQSIHFNLNASTAWLIPIDKTAPKTISNKSNHGKSLSGPHGNLELVGATVYNFTLSYHKELLHIDYGKPYVNNVNEVIPKSSCIAFEPFIGLSLNKVENAAWLDTSDSFYDNTFSSDTAYNSGDTVYTGSVSNLNSGFAYYLAGEKIVKHFFGASLQVGFRIQFKKHNKDRLALNFRYNQGFTQLLYSPFEYPTNPNLKGRFATRGTFWSISASYPITIVNKKGERYRDRHPKD